MTPAVIDTLHVLDSAHKLFRHAIAIGKDHPDESLRMTNIANAGFSAVIPYIRNRSAPVQKKHYEAMKTMMDEAEKHE